MTENKNNVVVNVDFSKRKEDRKKEELRKKARQRLLKAAEKIKW